MAMMQGRHAVEFDALGGSDGTLLANEVSFYNSPRHVNTAITLPREHAYWGGQIPDGVWQLNLWIHSNAPNGGGDDFVFTLEGHTSDNFDEARTTLAAITLTDTTAANSLAGQHHTLFKASDLRRLLSDLAYAALVVTQEDASADISYTAWLSYRTHE